MASEGGVTSTVKIAALLYITLNLWSLTLPDTPAERLKTRKPAVDTIPANDRKYLINSGEKEPWVLGLGLFI